MENIRTEIESISEDGSTTRYTILTIKIGPFRLAECPVCLALTQEERLTDHTERAHNKTITWRRD